MTTPNAGLEGLVAEMAKLLEETDEAAFFDEVSNELWRILCGFQMVAKEMRATPVPGAEGDARDAARYRWLRKNPGGTLFPVGCPDYIPGCLVFHRRPFKGEELDTAIDTALASRRELGGVVL